MIPGTKEKSESPFERLDLRHELDRLDTMLEELRVQHEQFFAGLVPLLPDRLHADVKRLRRRLFDAPFKNSEANYRLKSLENRYHTYRSYWERVMREREAGTYVRDVFKANLRERFALEDERAATEKGKAEHHLVELYKSYRSALERQAGRRVDIDFDAFKKTIAQRSKAVREKHGCEKVSFRVAVKDGRVTLQARIAKKAAAP